MERTGEAKNRDTRLLSYNSSREFMALQDFYEMGVNSIGPNLLDNLGNLRNSYFMLRMTQENLNKLNNMIDSSDIVPDQGFYSNNSSTGLSDKTFKSQELLDDHFSKHGTEIQKALGEDTYPVDQYLSDANHIIKNGTYVPELNGYVRFMAGKKYGFVGLDRATGNITTFHIKTVSELSKNAPSLGLRR